MKLSKKNFLVRFATIGQLGGYKKYPKNLCSLFWTCVFKGLFLILIISTSVFLLIGFFWTWILVFNGVDLDFIQKHFPWLAPGFVIVNLAILLTIAFFIVSLIQKTIKRLARIEKLRNNKVVEAFSFIDLVGGFIKAKKEKMCPLIEYYEK